MQLVRRLPPRVSGRSVAGWTERRVQAAKRTRSRPGTRTGARGRTLQSPPPQAGRDSTSPGHGHRPPDQPGQCATGLPTLAVTRPKHRDAEDAPRQQGHDAGNPGPDEEMTEASAPQESRGPPPTTGTPRMSPQQEPSTGSIPEGHPDAAPGHFSPTGTTEDQDRETIPPPSPRLPQRRNTDLFDGEELRAIYNIHANTSPCGLVAALRRHLQDVNPNRLFPVIPLPHAASTDISLRQLEALVNPGMQIADDLVDT